MNKDRRYFLSVHTYLIDCICPIDTFHHPHFTVIAHMLNHGTSENDQSVTHGLVMIAESTCVAMLRRHTKHALGQTENDDILLLFFLSMFGCCSATKTAISVTEIRKVNYKLQNNINLLFISVCSNMFGRRIAPLILLTYGTEF